MAKQQLNMYVWITSFQQQCIQYIRKNTYGANRKETETRIDWDFKIKPV